MKEVKTPKKPLIYYYGIVLLVLIVFNLVVSPILMEHQVEETDYGTFMSMINDKNIGKVEVEDNQIVFTDKDEKNVYQTNVMDDPNLTERLYESGAKFSKDVDASTSPLLSLLITGLLPMLIFIGLGQYMAKKLREQMGGKDSLMFGGMGKSNAKIYVQSTKGIRFDDVAGEDEAKESLAEIVDYLHNPQKYTAIGAKLPKGALLVGSPGTGKTLIQRFLLDIYRRKNRGAKIICCAPTGRAARRMEQSTGFPATTIHKALGLLAGEDGDYCEPEMLDADLIVVDEVSMMDIYLANHLFRSVPHGSQLVLIGDADQLPSVGPGAVLSEIIACGAVPVVRLDRIFRQSYGSRIAANAKLIRHGNLSLEYGEDFQFYDSCDMSASAQQIETLYLQETARYGVDNVALLTPYRQKTETGVNALNERLREKLNPQDGKKPEVAYRKRIYRLGDKVMQIKNCEDISNGDIGYITSVTRDDTDSVLTVDFGDGRIAEYDGSDLEMLDLAYASTIHKSQGSEYKSVIINLQCAHAVMLVRPLVYTAITRAKERVLIVGERRALCIAIKRTDTEQRGTMLSARIKELISNVKGDHYNGNLAQ